MKQTPLKYELIRTPLEQPALWLRRAAQLPRRIRYPELAELLCEDGRIQQVLARALAEDTNCLDVGAHFGSVLSSMVRLAPRGRHIAIEAVPNKCEFLRRKFPEVRVMESAVSDAPGTVTFHINLDRSGFSSLRRHGGSDERYTEVTVPCGALDDLMQGTPRIGFMKVDVEGAEEMVFRGGARFLTSNRPIVLFECGPSGALNFGSTPVACFDVLRALDYDVFFIKDWLSGGQSASRRHFEDALVYPFAAFNWIAEPRSRGRVASFV